MAEIIDSPRPIFKPYFNLLVRKIAGADAEKDDLHSWAYTSLNDENVLTETVSAEPLSLVVETERVTVKTEIVHTTALVEEHIPQLETDNSVNDTLLGITWVCLGLAIVAMLLTCLSVQMRRTWITKLHKVHALKEKDQQLPTETEHIIETQHASNDFRQPAEPLDEEKDSNLVWKDGNYSNGPKIVVEELFIKMGSPQSRTKATKKGLGSVLSGRTRDSFNLQSAAGRSEAMRGNSQLQEDAAYDEGLNAFNTDDALKQDDNPTYAINPQIMKSAVKRFDVNSQQALREQVVVIDCQFNTPGARTDNPYLFDHNSNTNTNNENDSHIYHHNIDSSSL